MVCKYVCLREDEEIEVAVVCTCVYLREDEKI